MYTVKVFAFDPLGPDGEFGTSDDWQSYYADPVENIDLTWGGMQLISVSMAQMGRISGAIGAIDMYGDLKNMPWVGISTGESFAYSTSPVTADFGLGYSDEAYYMWLPVGTHDLSVSVSGLSQIFAPAGATIVVADGFSTSYDQTLIPTGVPVPEFPTTTVLALLSALSASIFLLRRKRIVK
jgi:hypothetical protein